MVHAERGKHLNIKVHEIGLVNVSDAARKLRRDSPELVVVIDATWSYIFPESSTLEQDTADGIGCAECQYTNIVFWL